MNREKTCIVVGSSRGLGAALVEELLRNNVSEVIGVSRSKSGDIEKHLGWLATGRYRYVELDITAPDAMFRLEREVVSQLPPKPVLVVYNAAIVETDVLPGGVIDPAATAKIHRVGVDGLSHVVGVFQEHLLQHGGVLAGISSFGAFLPPVLEKRVAYPAIKAYMDMFLKCLRTVWKEKAKVVIVHLGHFGEPGERTGSGQAVPTSTSMAQKIVKKLLSSKIPNEINIPFSYLITYKYFLRLIPESLYLALFSVLFRKSEAQDKV